MSSERCLATNPNWLPQGVSHATGQRHRSPVLATWRLPGSGLTGSAPVQPAGAAEQGEHWWPVALAILVTAVLHAALPRSTG
jgi:hypothetical protein